MSPVVARRRLAVGGGVLVASLVAYGVVADAPAESLVGRSDVASGMSSISPPPVGLSLSWTRPLLVEVPDFADTLLRWTPAVATGNRALVAGALVDLGTGNVLARRTDMVGGTPLGHEAVEVIGGELLVSDAMTGAILSRVTLPPQAAEFADGSYVFARHRDVTAITDAVDVLLVRDDGELVRALPGYSAAAASRVRPGSPYAVVRSEATRAVEVIEVASGDVVRSVMAPDSAGDSLVAIDIAGSTLVVAELAGGQTPSNDPGTWDVRIVDLAGQADDVELQMEANEAPILLGVVSNGAVLLGITQEGRTFALPILNGQVQPSLSAVRPRSTSPGVAEPAFTAAAAVLGLDGDLIVSVDEMETVMALDAVSGTVVWAQGVEGARDLRTFDGIVAVGTDDEGEPGAEFSPGPIKLLDADDGETLATVAAPRELYSAFVAGGDGTVGVAPESLRSHPRGVPMASIVWTQVDNGAPSTAAAAFGQWLTAARAMSDDPPAQRDLVADIEEGLLAGTVADGGVLRPVIVQTPDDELLRILGRDGRFFDVNLSDGVSDGPDPNPDIESATPSYYGYFVDVRGVAAGHLVAHRVLPDDRMSMVLVDLDDGGVRRVPDVSPDKMLGELVLGADFTGFDLDGWGPEWKQVWTLVDPRTGAIAWSLSNSQWLEGVAADEELVVITTRASVLGLAPGDGAERWQTDLDVLLHDGVVLTERHVVVTSVVGDVVALDRVTGEVAWRSSSVGVEANVVVGAGTHVLLGTVDGRIVHLDDSGVVIDDVRALAGPVRDLSVHGDTVVVLGRDRVVGLRRGGRGFSELDEVGG